MTHNWCEKHSSLQVCACVLIDDVDDEPVIDFSSIECSVRYHCHEVIKGTLRGVGLSVASLAYPSTSQ